MRPILILITGLTLAGCGADGEPVQPTARTNVNISPNGVSAAANMRIGQGPLSVNLGVAL